MVLDSYSLLIVSRFFEYDSDFINITFVCKKFRDTLEKLHYNPIPISLKTAHLFPKLETQYLYTEKDEVIECPLHKKMYTVTLTDKINHPNFTYTKVVLDQNSVTSKKLTTIPHDVQGIGAQCFLHSEMTSLVLPNNIITLEESCFESCSKLESVTLSPHVSVLPFCCFMRCGSLKRFVIPRTVQYMSNAIFFDCTSLSEVIFENDIDELYEETFAYCVRLSKIVLPNSIKKIGLGCFRFCVSLPSLHLPEKCLVLFDKCFEGCSTLSKVTLPKHLASVEFGCFKECFSLRELVFPESTVHFGVNAFYGCTSLTQFKVRLGYGQKHLSDISTTEHRVLSVFPITFPRVLLEKVDAQEIIDFYKTNIVVIPENVCTRLGQSCFQGLKFAEVLIPYSVESILEEAFKNSTGYTTIYIPNSVTMIGTAVFKGCTDLRYITLPNTIQELKKEVFANCVSLTSIEFGKNIEKVGDYCFQDCQSLVQIDITNVNKLGLGVFEGCTALTAIGNIETKDKKYKGKVSLNEVSVLERLHCEFDTVYITPQDTTQNEVFEKLQYKVVLTDWCFKDTQIIEYKIPDNVTELGVGVFANSMFLTQVTISKNVVLMKEHCFSKCANLKRVVFESETTTVGPWCFSECPSLVSIVGIHELSNTVSFNLSRVLRLNHITYHKLALSTKNVLREVINMNQNINVYSLGQHGTQEDSTETIIPSNCIEIDKNALAGDCHVETIVIPSSVTKLNECCFGYCSYVKKVIFETTRVTEIPKECFATCYELESIHLPRSITSIQEDAFDSCNALTSFTISNSVKDIGEEAFGHCVNLKALFFEENSLIRSLPNSFLFQSIAVTEINLPQGLTEIGFCCFLECYSLVTLKLPQSLLKIKENAFKKCYSLHSIVLNDGLQSIGNFCFCQCNALKTLSIPSTVTFIGISCFLDCGVVNLNLPLLCIESVDASLFDTLALTKFTINNEVITNINYTVSYSAAKMFGEIGITCDCVIYTRKDRLKYGNTIPPNVCALDDFCFIGSGLQTIKVPKSVKRIGHAVFEKCTVEISNSNTKYEHDSFINCPGNESCVFV
ncbi:hypothetical protein EIN_097020 [Entamoeba invadens IP1]|uniref:Leucine rich repeat containing protein BspA family protein n=1 Tax=Entamoeba invadens IP1 TaxID=370355 RepID=A0A0A1U0L4_ENTIV|nr:hypothetical protein EIN_097020 [Entamoeba invadens IP1]ELP87435.1 hypothetical protein EIN_097020 [Entamoeba invadens IP1]|eukprot:XP_004254206.1 hypothetical protein EIN_097020 [Entamoeba invadens IP1]